MSRFTINFHFTINSFLDPLVDELLDFWDGVWINTPSTGPKFCLLALVCTTCDIPASRKLCGFLSFSAKMGCNKCKKEFPRPAFGAKQDFSGFNWSSWTLRTDAEHRIWTGYLKTNMVFCCCFYCRSYTVLLPAYCHRSIPN